MLEVQRIAYRSMMFIWLRINNSKESNEIALLQV
jgi:hypothetical protein